MKTGIKKTLRKLRRLRRLRRVQVEKLKIKLRPYIKVVAIALIPILVKKFGHQMEESQKAWLVSTLVQLAEIMF